MLEVSDVLAGGRKNLDKAKARASNIIVSCGILLRVSNEEAAANILNVERRKPARDVLGSAVVTIVVVIVIAIAIGIEGIVSYMYPHVFGVVNFDAALAEICDVQIVLPIE